jgi:hypothetical protein
MADLKKVNLRKKAPATVEIFLDITNPESPMVISELEEKKLDKNKLGENVIRLESTWRRVNFNLLNLIEMNQYIDKLVNGRLQRVFDIQALILARIKVLLMGWNLKDLDDKLGLDFEPSIDDKDVEILSVDCMKRLGEVDPPSIINVFYTKAMDALFPEERELLKNLEKEAKDLE